MYTEAAARLLTAGQQADAPRTARCPDTAQEALREMRLLIYQLRPPVLEKGGWPSPPGAIGRRGAARRHSCRADARSEDGCRPPSRRSCTRSPRKR